ncbi:MAG: hypothetical protein ACOYJ2_04980 [Rickettsiales bacterium]
MVEKTYNDGLVKKGDISTYVHASDAWLEKRKKQLRGFVNDPELTPNEIVDSVALPVTVAGIGVGWSAWQVVEKGIEFIGERLESSNFHWAKKYLKYKNGTVSYLPKHTARNYQDTLSGMAHRIASFLINPDNQTFAGGMDLLDDMIEEPQRIGHTGAIDELTALKKELEAYRVKTINNPRNPQHFEHVQTRILETLEKIQAKSPQYHVSQYHTIWKQIKVNFGYLNDKMKAYPALPIVNPVERVATKSFNQTWDGIRKLAQHDNDNIIKQWRNPITAVAVLGAGLIIGIRSYTGARKQQLLEWETEASFIERIQDERSKVSVADIPAKDAPAKSHKDRVSERRHAVAQGEHTHAL